MAYRELNSTGTGHVLRSFRKAEHWTEAYPLGNGSLGAMVYGDPLLEKIDLNADSLWSGIRNRDKVKDPHRDWSSDIDRVRRLLDKGKYSKADAFIEKNIKGQWTQAFLPAGSMKLKMGNQRLHGGYKRELNMREGLVDIRYTAEDGEYTRKAFVSYPDSVLVYHLTVPEMGKNESVNTMEISLDSDLRHSISTDGCFVLQGLAPSWQAPPYAGAADPVIYDPEAPGISYCIMVKVCGAQTTAFRDNKLIVSFKNKLTLLTALTTDFNAESKPEEICEKILRKSEAKGYKELLRNHREDFLSLYSRVALDLKARDSGIGTDESLKRTGIRRNALNLQQQLFNYGRYLLISSSRPGSQPANLQGIWNNKSMPPWSSNYTLNINTQMNYWPAEICNLSECHEPLIKFIEELSLAGEETARSLGCRGSASHHNSDLWRQTVQVKGSPSYAFWPMSGVWLTQHLWEHYLYSGDLSFLQNKALPVMERSVLFSLDWLVKSKDGDLITSPSTSPENSFRKGFHSASASIGSTMDLSLISELFDNYIKACRLCGETGRHEDEVLAALDNITPYRIGKKGQLQEWREDFKELFTGHRHLSHLFSLFPGSRLTKEEFREMAGACRTTLKRRVRYGKGWTGWSIAWQTALYARLGDGNKAEENLLYLLKECSFPNLMGKHKLSALPFTKAGVFQIDSNFGICAAMAEMLLQSHGGIIRLLPALPDAWSDGSVIGLCARGGYEIDMEWRSSELTSACIRSRNDNLCMLELGEKLTLQADGKRINCSRNGSIITFPVKAGVRYTIGKNHED